MVSYEGKSTHCRKVVWYRPIFFFNGMFLYMGLELETLERTLLVIAY